MDEPANTSPLVTPSVKELVRTFFWIGMTAFGGLAMTAHIRRYIVERKKWMQGQVFDSGLALCQLIPGAIVMQLVAYVGLKLHGKRGALLAFVSFGFPAFLIMFALTVLYKESKNLAEVKMILTSLRVVIVAIVASAAISFGKKNFHTLSDWIIAAVSAFLFFIHTYPLLVLLAASLLGIFLGRNVPRGHADPTHMKTLSFFLIMVGGLISILGLMWVLDKDYFLLATLMLRIDLFSFGGGLAATPVMYHELVDLFGWIDRQTFMDGIILGQVTPGSIIIAATFFGYMHAGPIGSVISTLFVFTPSFMILMGLIPFFDRLKTYPNFNRIINGILCAFTGLLLVVTYNFTLNVHWDLQNILVALLALLLILRNVNIVWIILGGALFAFLP